MVQVIIIHYVSLILIIVIYGYLSGRLSPGMPSSLVARRGTFSDTTWILFLLEWEMLGADVNLCFY